MKGKGSYLTAFVFLFLMFVAALPAWAEVTYRDVARSINDSFSGGQGFSMRSIVGFALTILGFVFIGIIFRLFWLKEERESLEKRRRKVVLRPRDRHQKRSWFRLKTSALFEWIPAREALQAKKNQYKRDRMVDISGGGLCFMTAERLNPGDEITMYLDTGGVKPLAINGKVLRSGEEIEEISAMYRVSVQFGRLTSGDRDKIVSYIMRRQRDAAKDEGKPAAVKILK